jgi:outer membrane protein assembly factor BamD
MTGDRTAIPQRGREERLHMGRSERVRGERMFRRSRLGGTAAALALIATACAGGEPAKPATAEDFFNKGVEQLQGSRRLFLFSTVDYPAAIASFQEVITNFPFSEYATLAELKVADAYFDQGKFEESASFYQDFIELHPTHPQVPYALLRNGECAFKQMLKVDQDQAKTRAALEQFDVLLERHPSSDQIARAKELRGLALDQLALHEVEIGDFYFGSETYHAAVPRYKVALEKSPQHPGHERTQARLGIALARSGQRQEGVRMLEPLTAEGLDGDLVDQVEAELGRPLTAAAEEESSGFRLWPFGGSDDEAGEGEISAQSRLEAEKAAVEANSAAPETADAEASGEPAEQGSGRWFWPF